MKIRRRWLCFGLSVFILLGLYVRSQENQGFLNKQMKDALMALYKTDNEQIAKLKEEIIAVYTSQGEIGLRNFIKERRKEINYPIIFEFMDLVIVKKEEQMIKISAILSEEKKSEKAFELWVGLNYYYQDVDISGILYEYNSYTFLYVWAQMEMCMCHKTFERALGCFENLIPQVEKLNHPIAKEIQDLLKTIIYAFKKEFKTMDKLYDEELLSAKDRGDIRQMGRMYIGKAAIYLNSGDFSRTCDMCEKALTLFEKAGDVNGQGIVYMLWGNLYIPIGDYIRANRMFDKALPFFKKSENLQYLCIIFRKKAEIYQIGGKYFRSLDMYDKVLHALEKTQYNQTKAEIYLAKGDVYQKAGDSLKAREMYNTALALFENKQDPIEKRFLYETSGFINLIDGKFSNAIRMYEQAIPLYSFTDYGHFGGAGDLYKTIGELHFLTGSYTKSVDMYNRAFQQYKKLGRSEFLSPVLYRKGLLMEKLGKPEQSLFLFEESIKMLEEVRWQTGFSWMKLSLMEKIVDQYEDIVLFMLENKYDIKGFKYAESMKARLFLDQLAEGLVRLDKGLELELKEDRERCVAKLSSIAKQMQETSSKNEKKLQQLKEEYRQVESQLEELLIKIRLENPLYASVNYPQPVSVRDLQSRVLKEGETLLSYFITPGKSYAFIVSKDNFRVMQLPVKEKEVNVYIDRYLLAIKENNANDINRFGSLLYEKLFNPLEKYLKKSREVIIVPAGKLETIPFESLIVSKKKTGQPVYLLEKYRLKYVQSASLLSILRKYYSRDNTARSFIGFGDPVYDYENFKQGKPEQGSNICDSQDENEIKEIHRDRYARVGGIMDRLPHSGEEIKTIARLFEKNSLKSVVHLREQATEDNVKATDMKDFDFIHFSCHGVLSDDFQSLVFSQLPLGKSNEDGYFTLNEIMNCDYNASLVVLSACETGTGKMYKGEGVTGMTRAVMYAGAPAVVASLWKVDDIATKELMVMFYENLLEKKMDKVEALRQAKLELLKNKKYNSPLYWSAFVMYGE